MRKYLVYLLIVILILISLELLLKIYSSFTNVNFINDNRYTQLFKVYSQGKIFKSHNDFYLYEKNLSQKRYLNFYYDKKNSKLKKIWDYKFSTNNYGLVQNFDLDKKKKSILFLGDSFTEGQGAEPWLNSLGNEFNGLQIINGGIQGTGFIQFENLEKYLSNIFNIQKTVVIFISPDVRRGIVKAKNSKCLENFSSCDVKDYTLGIPDDENFDIESFVLDKAKFDPELHFKKKIRYFIRDLYLYNYTRTIVNTFRLRNNNTIKNNLKSILSLKKKYLENILFIKIKDPNEIMFKRNTYETRLIDNFFKNNNIKYHYCEMNNDLKLFHRYDFHPNKSGYKNLKACVLNVLNTNF